MGSSVDAHFCASTLCVGLSRAPCSRDLFAGHHRALTHRRWELGNGADISLRLRQRRFAIFAATIALSLLCRHISSRQLET
jgi:hypothetical protein